MLDGVGHARLESQWKSRNTGQHEMVVVAQSQSAARELPVVLSSARLQCHSPA